MAISDLKLLSVYEGWDGYQVSLLHAVEPLTPSQLAWRPAERHRSVGELVRHVALGRLTWFLRIDAPGSRDLAAQIPEWETDEAGNRYAHEESVPITTDATLLAGWLSSSWGMVDRMLKEWDIADLRKTYRHTWNRQTYQVSYQWTIWRIMAHDIHHGGELSLMLGMQGIEAFELSGLGGHITMPPLAQSA